MRRWIAILGALAALATGCSTRTAGASAPCRMDAAPAAGEVTYLDGARLMAVGPDGQGRRCLGDHLDAAPQWGARGDAGLAGPTRLVSVDRAASTGFAAADHVSISPADTSLLAVTTEGRLTKRPVAGGAAEDISVFGSYDAAVYHPSGQAMVVVGQGEGENGGGGYGIYLADTNGAIQLTLAAAETSRHIDSLAWTDDGRLVFAAQHADRWDLHSLDLATGTITTLASTTGPDQPITNVVTSPFAGGGIAWQEGACGPGRTPVTKLRLAGELIALPPALDSAVPVGWLPDASLVLLQRSAPCGGGTAKPATARSAGDVYTVRGPTVTKVATGATDATVRVAHPAPPPLPTHIPSDAPI
ncbi:MAG TPA: hypothetical protein VGO87_09180 [Acidimicrobiia bacterium]